MSGWIVRVRWGHRGEYCYPTERLFGSSLKPRKVRLGVTLEGKPLEKTVYTDGVSLSPHEVLMLLQRQLRRPGVDRILIMRVKE